MSLKHLFAGIMVVGFALVVGVDPVKVAPEAVSPGYVAADKVVPNDCDEKPPAQSDKDRDRDKASVADTSKATAKAEEPAAPETFWGQRLVFPSGNKF